MLRKKIIIKSFNNRGMFIKARSNKEISMIVNNIAPEHLEIMSKDYKLLLKNIYNAGAIFLGEYSPEVFGDYCAGPNHVLPTSTTARFASPLGVYDFQKRSSLIQCSAESSANIGRLASVVARSESLTAHARSAEMRIESLARDDKEGGASDR